MTRTADEAFDFSQVASCKIHPGIGIARVGNSPDAFFIGPEVPGDPTAATAPDGGYKDEKGCVKRQAARFRIYGYDESGKNLGELPLIGPDDAAGAVKAAVQWKVHLANRKGAGHRWHSRQNGHAALRNPFSVPGQCPDKRPPEERRELIIDPGVRSITGAGTTANRTFDGGEFLGTEVPLGELRTDTSGRLLVLGGFGAAGSTKRDNPIGADPDDAGFATDNDYYYDDIADGQVNASVSLPDGRTIDIVDSRDAAWVVVAPPKYAPGVTPIVTLFDVVREVALDAKWLSEEPDVSVHRDIHPLLTRITDGIWVNNNLRRGYKSLRASMPAQSSEDRARLFDRFRNPLAQPAVAKSQANAKYFPPLSGNGGSKSGEPASWLTITPSRFVKLRKWKDGEFTTVQEEAIRDFTQLSPDAQTMALQQAALEPCIGGAFDPGVEMSHTAARAELYADAFRIDADTNQPGDITKHLSLPWQAGMYLRRERWWPAARPDDVVPQDVFEEVDRLWRKGGKLVSEGLEGRAKWDRGLGVSTLLRRPWQNPAIAVDDPRDADRRGADDMVRYWSELGFVVPRRTASGEIIHVETERRPYAGMDIRELFHAMLNLEENPGCLPKVVDYVDSVLAAAREIQHLPTAFNFMNNIRPFRYNEEIFEARMKDIYDDCVEFAFSEKDQTYDPEDENHNPYFRNREHVIERIRQMTPFNFLDGAWLRNVHRLGPMDEVNSILFSIFNEELGDGVLSQNHANVYRDLCHSIDFYPPPVASMAFARDPRFLDSAFESATFQLGIAEYTERYYPEIIGMTLWLEWTALELHRIAAIVERVGLSAHFYRMHIAIDNAEDGHAAGSLRAVKLYLHQVMLQGGDQAVQEQWRRIWDGYVAFALTFSILVQQIIMTVKEPQSLQVQLEHLIRRKKTYGQYNHGARELCGIPVNDWFNEPRGFLRSLITAGFVVPGKPESSPFLELLGFRGPMYHVFTEAEIKLWRSWILEEAAQLRDSADNEAEQAADIRRLKQKLATDPGLSQFVSGERLNRLQRATSARRIALWIDLAERQIRAARGSDDTHDPAQFKCAFIESRFKDWLGWGMVRAFTHLTSQPWTDPTRSGIRLNGGAIAKGRTVADWLSHIREGASPARAARDLMQALSEEFGEQDDTSGFMKKLASTPLAQAFELAVPANDGRRLRDIMGAWLESGCPLPDVPAGEFKPLRLDSTLDEEEHHPTGVAVGFGTMH
jgi:hypothetical protein